MAIHADIELEPEQHDALEELARARRVSTDRIVQEAVSSYLPSIPTRLDTDRDAYRTDPLWDLLEVAEGFEESGCDDLAERHDDHLYGGDTIK